MGVCVSQAIPHEGDNAKAQDTTSISSSFSSETLGSRVSVNKGEPKQIAMISSTETRSAVWFAQELHVLGLLDVQRVDELLTLKGKKDALGEQRLEEMLTSRRADKASGSEATCASFEDLLSKHVPWLKTFQSYIESHDKLTVSAEATYAYSDMPDLKASQADGSLYSRDTTPSNGSYKPCSRSQEAGKIADTYDEIKSSTNDKYDDASNSYEPVETAKLSQDSELVQDAKERTLDVVFNELLLQNERSSEYRVTRKFVKIDDFFGGFERIGSGYFSWVFKSVLDSEEVVLKIDGPRTRASW